MALLYKGLLKPIFFQFDPEFVHDRIVFIGSIIGRNRWLKGAVRSFSYSNTSLNQELFGIHFKNPVGLSAGFDKDGKMFGVMGSIGFGFAEVGTVTYKSYVGNPTPRLLRLPKSKGLVVYYGLKNEGSKAVIERLKNTKQDIPQVISIGRTNSKETACFEDGLEDFINGIKEFNNSNVGNVYEINISCPNTYGGEPFTDASSLNLLLSRVAELNINKPIFIKMPINLDWDKFKELVDVAIKYKVDALVIGNLNKNRDGLLDKIPQNIKGNISGKPTEILSNYLIKQTYKYAGDKIKIVGVGGIFSAEDTYKKIKLGASLVEIITGMIFEGPQLVGQINKKLAYMLKEDGFKNISEAIGIDA